MVTNKLTSCFVDSMKILKSFKIVLISYLTTFTFTQSLSADEIYSGQIARNSRNEFYLVQKEAPRKFKLQFEVEANKLLLQRLKENDYVSVQGVYSPQLQQIVVSSVVLVGLTDLLGLWLGDDNNCYLFENYTTLYIYSSDPTTKCAYPTSEKERRLRKLNYYVNPDIYSWYLVINDEESIFAAEVILKNSRTTQINLFDDESGDIFSKITLRR